MSESTMTPVEETVQKPRKKRKGLKQAAQLMVSLGPEASSMISKYLSRGELEMISREIHSLGNISPLEKKAVVRKFYETAYDRDFVSSGGEEYARKLLAASLGERKADSLLEKFREGDRDNIFGMLERVDASTAANFLKKEHPQTIALILATLPTRYSGQVLMNLPEEVRTNVSYRMATIEHPGSEVIVEIQEILGEYVNTDVHQVNMKFGGTAHVAETFNEIDQSIWRNILEEIGDIDPVVAEEIKNQMFTFADLILLDKKSMQTLLKDIDNKELIMALKGASEEVHDLVFRNMSKRAGGMIKEEMEFLGAVRVSEVESAQQRIIDTVRDLEMDGQIFIAGRGEDDSGFVE